MLYFLQYLLLYLLLYFQLYLVVFHIYSYIKGVPKGLCFNAFVDTPNLNHAFTINFLITYTVRISFDLSSIIASISDINESVNS